MCGGEGGERERTRERECVCASASVREREYVCTLVCVRHSVCVRVGESE